MKLTKAQEDVLIECANEMLSEFEKDYKSNKTFKQELNGVFEIHIEDKILQVQLRVTCDDDEWIDCDDE